MANPQAEDGHVDIANEIVEKLASIILSPDESRILWALFRKTYGWHKKEDHISNSQFSEITGIPRNHVPRVVNKLVSRNIIYRGVPQTGDTMSPKQGTPYITIYAFQKDFDKWMGCPPNRGLSPKQDKGVPQPGQKVSPRRGHTKETIQKKLYKRKSSFQSCDDEFWKKVKEIYTWIDIDVQTTKMKGYQLTSKGKNWKFTPKRVIYWLNQIEKPMEIKDVDKRKSRWGD